MQTSGQKMGSQGKGKMFQMDCKGERELVKDGFGGVLSIRMTERIMAAVSWIH